MRTLLPLIAIFLLSCGKSKGGFSSKQSIDSQEEVAQENPQHNPPTQTQTEVQATTPGPTQPTKTRQKMDVAVIIDSSLGPESAKRLVANANSFYPILSKYLDVGEYFLAHSNESARPDMLASQLDLGFSSNVGGARGFWHIVNPGVALARFALLVCRVSKSSCPRNESYTSCVVSACGANAFVATAEAPHLANEFGKWAAIGSDVFAILISDKEPLNREEATTFLYKRFRDAGGSLILSEIDTSQDDWKPQLELFGKKAQK